MQARISTQHQKIVIPYDNRVLSIVPNSRVIELDTGKHIALNHGIQESKLLTNLGYEVGCPILNYYGWAGNKAFDTQKQTAAMLVSNSRAYVLNSIGTGKTCAALFAYDYLREIGEVKKMLVIAPLSTITTVWEAEIFRRFSHLEAVGLSGSRQRRAKQLAQDADIYIINHDGIATIPAELQAMNFDVILIDELAVYRNSTTKRWKLASMIVRKAPYVWAMTGSPTPNAPTDAYGEAKLITPERVPFSYRRFQQETMRQVTTFKWVPRPDSAQVVYRALQPAVRFTRADSFDMPPTTIGYREAAMSDPQKVAYKDMLNTFAVEVRNKQITAANEGVKVSKLLQIACGFIYSSEDEGKKVINGTPRFKLLLEMIEETQEKIIVFTPFKFSVKMLATVLSKYHTVESVDGDTPKRERDRIFQEFQTDEGARIIVAHPGCMAHGLTLTKADTVIWFAPIWSTETYEQACGRITRAGQDKHTHILHIVGSPIENKIYKRLESNQKCQGILLDMFKVGTT
jgi:SNF2 family DNA or RNA helicase